MVKLAALEKLGFWINFRFFEDFRGLLGFRRIYLKIFRIFWIFENIIKNLRNVWIIESVYGIYYIGITGFFRNFRIFFAAARSSITH
jgi:hypothetical protein